MQAVGKVYGARPFHGLFKHACAASRTRVNRPLPLAARSIIGAGSFVGFQGGGDTLQFSGGSLDLTNRRTMLQSPSRCSARARDIVSHERQHSIVESLFVTQILDGAGKDVELPLVAKGACDRPKSAAEFSRGVALKLKDWQEFPQAPGADPGLVDRPDIALRDARSHLRKVVDLAFEKLVSPR
jgi:hypothetical protein